MPTTPLYQVAQIREQEARLVDAGAYTWPTLMAEAASALWAVLRQHYAAYSRWLVVCGAGHNGGDGWVLARLAHDAGVHIQVVSLIPVDQLQGLPADVAQAAIQAGVPHSTWQGSLPDGDLIIDAIFGIGFKGSLTDAAQALCQAINAQSAPVVAVDVPSGLAADTGVAAIDTVRANMTVTYIGHKVGLHTGDGRAVCGYIVLCDLGVRDMSKVSPCAEVDFAPWASPLPTRDANTHKGSYGHVCVVGGDPCMLGAGLLAAKAASRMGAGKVTLLADPAHIPALVASMPSCMMAPWTVKTVQGVPQSQVQWPKQADVLLLGPGMGRTPQAMSLFQAACSHVQAMGVSTLVLDADALYALGDVMEGDAVGSWPKVITPHPGEAATLLGVTVDQVQADRLQAAATLAERYQAVCVLKGVGTIVAEAGRLPCVFPVGSPALAKGGTGDVLAGMIAALLAQGLTLWDAAVMAVGVHGQAGVLAASVLGERAVMAEDVIAYLVQVQTQEQA